MSSVVDVLVIGGGIAGVALAAKIAGRASTVVLERESALGYHASGRSATSRASATSFMIATRCSRTTSRAH